jgi:hypothetical protein
MDRFNGISWCQESITDSSCSEFPLLQKGSRIITGVPMTVSTCF